MRVAVTDAVVVTGAGAVSAAGDGCAALWECAASGREVLVPSARVGDGLRIGAVPGHEDVRLEPSGGAAAQELCVAFAVAAGREALAAAGLVARRGVGLVFGSNLYDRPDRLDVLAGRVAHALGLDGPRLVVSTACASSATAIALAKGLLRDERVEAVLAGGSDVLTPLVVAGFRVLGLLAPDRCAPFSTPVGMSLGEGAGFVVLERAASGRRRGADVRATLAGVGLAGDAFHATSPDPRGEGLARAIGRALQDAGVQHPAIAYVNAHGTGTETGDIAECRGLARAFAGKIPPLSASKSIVGHAQGAAGAIEAVLTLEGLARGLAPPTRRHVGARPGCEIDAIAEGPRALAGETVLSVNTGFGGSAAALMFTRGVSEPGEGVRRAVWLRDVSQVMSGSAGGDSPLTAAARAVLDGIEGEGGDVGAGRGLFAVQAEVAPGLVQTTEAAIVRRGIDRVPAQLFARALLIAPAGECSAALDLRGPLCSFVGGSGEAAAALICAAEQVASVADVQCMLVGAVEECAGEPGRARCAVLSDMPDRTCPIRLAGWALAGADDDACARAIEDAGLAAVDRASEVTGGCAALLSALAEMMGWFREGLVRSASLTASEPGCRAALVLVRGEG